MSFARTTTYWGVAAVLGIAGYGITLDGAQQGNDLPLGPAVQAPSAPPPQSVSRPPEQKAPYELAWSDPIFSVDAMNVAVVATTVLVSGPTIGMSARASDDGRKLWATAEGVVTAPILGADLLIAATATHLVALETNTGRERWRREMADRVLGMAMGPQAVVTAAGSRVVAYQLLDGTEAWRADLDAPVVTPPSVNGPTVVTAVKTALVALDAGTGRRRWTVAVDGAPRAVAVAQDRVFTSTPAGSVCSYALDTGAFGWCFAVAVPLAGGPAPAGRDLFAAFLDNQVRKFDARTGAMRERYDLGARPIAEPVLAGSDMMIALVNGQVVLVPRQGGRGVARLSSPDYDSSPSLQSAAIGPDTQTIAMVTTAPGSLSLLAVFRKKAS